MIIINAAMVNLYNDQIQGEIHKISAPLSFNQIIILNFQLPQWWTKFLLVSNLKRIHCTSSPTLLPNWIYNQSKLFMMKWVIFNSMISEKYTI